MKGRVTDWRSQVGELVEGKDWSELEGWQVVGSLKQIFAIIVAIDGSSV